ncbi:MAG: 3-phosphoshikimate 1-carboxyvinyltransferase [Actinomycetia bacterium]|nr:3-phosphoshikimate 1-carboxyvinyltransferase [Actinomycetes bacterium]
MTSPHDDDPLGRPGGERAGSMPYEVIGVRRPIDTVVVVPGSKSITNRALLVAGLAEGESNLCGVLFADDTAAMMSSLETLGVGLDIDRDVCTARVTGIGGHPSVASANLNANQSGTTGRFLLPALAALPGRWNLDGDVQLRARPFDDQIAALEALGGRVESLDESGRLPMLVSGAGLPGGVVEVAGDVSSQFLSGLLMSGPLFSDGLALRVTTELVSRPYVDMTVAVMRMFGADVTEPIDGGSEWVVAGGGYTAADVTIEPDASAASYAFAAAAVTRGRVKVAGLSRDVLQGDIGFVEVLADMGATVIDDGSSITVDCTDEDAAALVGVDADMSQISDTAQTLAVVAATAEGATTVTGIGFVRQKETDRIGAVVTELQRLGVAATDDGDGFTVHPGEISPAVVQTYDDHRMAMSFALLGLVNEGVSIADPGCVAKTFPGYWSFLEGLGVSTSFILALDGPAGSGKSTVSRAVAEALGVAHFDTGAMYRAATWATLDRGLDPADSDAVASMVRDLSIEVAEKVTVDGVDVTRAIRTPEVTAVVSTVSAVPAVRRELVRLQRRFALGRPGCVVEGRDIGTVVFPDAPLKIYLTARVDVRATRRLAEMESKGLTGPDLATLDEITADIKRRDLADSSRADSPLRAAADAVVVDTSDRSVEDLVEEIASRTRRVWEE